MPPCLPPCPPNSLPRSRASARPWGRRFARSSALTLLLAAGLLCGGAVVAKAQEGDAAAETPPAAQGERITPYIRLKPLQANVIERGKVIATLAVAANLDSPTFETRQLARARMDRLNEGYLFALASFARTRVSLDRPVNVGVLAATLQRVTDKVLGPGVARVLIGFVALNKT